MKHSNLLLSKAEYITMTIIVKLLEPFKMVSETLCSETVVTSSLVIPYFAMLKASLVPKDNDLAVIKDIKKIMLENFETRYSEKQMILLASCTLLDVRYRAHSSFSPELRTDVVNWVKKK